jgi:hypothetical protein
MLFSTQARADWAEYVFPAQGFAISGPAEPEVEAAGGQNGTPAGQIVRFPSENGLFMIGVVNLPADVNPPAEEVLKGSLVGVLEPVQGRVTASRSITLDGVPGIEAQFESEKLHGYYRAFYSNKTLYQLSSLAPSNVPVDEDTLKWLVSFRLLK